MKTPQQIFPLAHTFSIVGRDERNGQLGVAVQSHWFSVGSIVAWAEAGVGAVATQSMVEVSFGPMGLGLMRFGWSASRALNALLAEDPGREVRQLAMVDTNGVVAVHSGQNCIAEAGHESGDGFSAQANMMLNAEVWPAMAEAYRRACTDPDLDLADRLLAALDAAQVVGGDARGQQSACIKVVAGKSSGRPWEDTLMDLRVEDHHHPIEELRRLVTLQRAYTLMNNGDAALAANKVEKALKFYSQAAGIAPQIIELPFWHAVALLNLGREAEAVPILREVFRAEPVWVEMMKRIAAVGLLPDDPELLRRMQEIVGFRE